MEQVIKRRTLFIATRELSLPEFASIQLYLGIEVGTGFIRPSPAFTVERIIADKALDNVNEAFFVNIEQRSIIRIEEKDIADFRHHLESYTPQSETLICATQDFIEKG